MGLDILSMIFWTVLVLSILVFFHEFGHFLAAKLSGIRVERFSVGFPPRVIGRKIGETDYCLSMTPLGGYCKMAGMIDESLDPDGIKGEPWEFMSKPIPVRMFVLFAGPLMNFVLAVALFAGLGYFNGIPQPDSSSRIGEVTPGTPAEKAELKPDDRIIAVDGVPVNAWQELTEIISARPLETVTLSIDRSGEIVVKEVMIEKRDNPTDAKDEEVGMLGIEQGIVFMTDAGVFASLGYGARQTFYLTTLVAGTAKSVVFGEESVKSLGGPLMIAKLTNESRKSGMETLIWFMAFLSLNLGFMNLLPIPVLDGGHMMILSAEGLVRRQLPVKVKLVIQQVGMALIFVLIAVIFYNDIMRFIAPG